ncbi:MAG: carbohydrate ABC transporter permease, partial [Niameybacter sp.]
MESRLGIRWVAKIGLILGIGLSLLPVAYVVMHSLKGEQLIAQLYTAYDVSIWEKTFIKPFYINLDQYYHILFQTPEFLYLFWNALMIVAPIVVLQTIIGLFAAYGLSKLKFKGSEVLFFSYIVIMLMPFQVTVVPNYMMLDKLGLLDRYGALILPGIFGTFGVFFLKQFMEGIDEAFIEEARLLGAGDLQILRYVVVPMCKPIIVTVALLLFVDYWNMVEQPLIFLTSKDKYPLSVYLASIAQNNISIGFACSVLYM